MKRLKELLSILPVLAVIFTCTPDGDGPRPVLAPPVVKLIPKMDTFSGSVGDTLEVTVAVEGERIFQSLQVNKIVKGNTVATYFLVEDNGDPTMPPYQEIFKYPLDEKDVGQPFDLEFRLERREETPSGGFQYGYSNLSVSVVAHE